MKSNNVITFPTAKKKPAAQTKQASYTHPALLDGKDRYPLNYDRWPTENLEDYKLSAQIDFRKEWDNSKKHFRRAGLSESFVLQHDVKLWDIGYAIGRAKLLAEDEEAVIFFQTLFNSLIDRGLVITPLKAIPPEFRGYVWSLNFTFIDQSKGFLHYYLLSLLGKQDIEITYY